MCFVEMVKETRTQYGFSQSAIAREVGVTQAAWSKYENKERSIPDDVAKRMAEIMKSPRLMNEYLYEKKAEFFNVPVLNNVDDNIIVVLDTVIEEATELIRNTQELKRTMKNKKSAEQITSLEWDVIMRAEEQIADLIPAIKLNFVVMVEKFGMDIKSLEDRLNRKLKIKGYKR
jgi:transcriptional regulator with XRE-family HTH domain